MKRNIILLCIYGTILCSCNTTRQVSSPKDYMHTQYIMTQNSTNSNDVRYVQCVTHSDNLDTIDAPRTEKKEGGKKFFRTTGTIIFAVTMILGLGAALIAPFL